MKARPIKELFQIVLSAGNREFKISDSLGICGFTCQLVGTNPTGGRISLVEYNIIRRYIKKNRPKPGDQHYRPSCKLDAYYWRIEAWGPRRNWIKDQIKKL